MKTVSYWENDIPEPTEQRKAELRALAQRPDSEIDYSDLPPLDDGFWQRAVPLKDARRSRPHNPRQQVTVTTAMDTDVLDWLKTQGQEWQQRMNAILREAMRHAQAKTHHL